MEKYESTKFVVSVYTPNGYVYMAEDCGEYFVFTNNPECAKTFTIIDIVDVIDNIKYHICLPIRLMMYDDAIDNLNIHLNYIKNNGWGLLRIRKEFYKGEYCGLC